MGRTPLNLRGFPCLPGRPSGKLRGQLRVRRRLSLREVCVKRPYCVVPATGHSGKGKATEAVRRPWLPGLGEDRWTGGAQGTFRAVKTLCVALSWHAHVGTCLSDPQNAQNHV